MLFYCGYRWVPGPDHIAIVCCLRLFRCWDPEEWNVFKGGRVNSCPGCFVETEVHIQFVWDTYGFKRHDANRVQVQLQEPRVSSLQRRFNIFRFCTNAVCSTMVIVFKVLFFPFLLSSCWCGDSLRSCPLSETAWGVGFSSRCRLQSVPTLLFLAAASSPAVRAQTHAVVVLWALSRYKPFNRDPPISGSVVLDKLKVNDLTCIASRRHPLATLAWHSMFRMKTVGSGMAGQKKQQRPKPGIFGW